MRESNGAIPQQDHKTLLQTIDACVISTSTAATNIENWLTEQRGPYMPYFSGNAITIGFYPSFSLIFRLTSRLSEMKQHGELINRIDQWMKPVLMAKEKPRDLHRMQEGIGLWNEYYNALNHSGVVTLRK